MADRKKPPFPPKGGKPAAGKPGAGKPPFPPKGGKPFPPKKK